MFSGNFHSDSTVGISYLSTWGRGTKQLTNKTFFLYKLYWLWCSERIKKYNQLDKYILVFVVTLLTNLIGSLKYEFNNWFLNSTFFCFLDERTTLSLVLKWKISLSRVYPLTSISVFYVITKWALSVFYSRMN